MKPTSNIGQMFYIMGTIYVLFSVVALLHEKTAPLTIFVVFIAPLLVLFSPFNYSWIKELREDPSSTNNVFIALHVVGTLVAFLLTLSLMGYINVEFGHWG